MSGPGRDRTALLCFRRALDWGGRGFHFSPRPGTATCHLHMSRGGGLVMNLSPGLLQGDCPWARSTDHQSLGCRTAGCSPCHHPSATGEREDRLALIGGTNGDVTHGPKVRVERLGGQATDRDGLPSPSGGAEGARERCHADTCLQPIGPGTLSKLKRFRCARNGPLQTVAKYFSCSGWGVASGQLPPTIPFAAKSRDW